MTTNAQQALNSGLFLGFDPGGKKRFGVASIIGSKISFETVSNIKQAIDWSIAASNRTTPHAIGVDTILHWATGQSGFRSADNWLRKKYPTVSRSVMPPNGLYGAMTIGGVGLAIGLKKIWPNLLLNETHPKVLYHALTEQTYPRENLSAAIEWLVTRAKLDPISSTPSDDEFDAILSAWATREALNNRWIDLAVVDDEHIYPINNVHYFWPESN